MFNYNSIQTAFKGLVGLRQNNNPEFPQLFDSLIYDGSNLLVHHPLLSIENIDMSARNYAFYQFDAWDNLTNYVVDDRIRYTDDKVYEAIQANVGSQPDTNPLDWSEVNLLSLYLEDTYNNSVNETVNEVFQKKKLNRQTKTLLQNQKLTTGSGSLSDYITNEGDLVGIEIKLLHRENIKAVINKIGLQVSQANPTMKFYVYHSSQLEPLTTITVDHQKAISFGWNEVDLELNFNSISHDVGGVFYLMYDQSELVGSAIKKSHNWHLAPCRYCNRADVDYFNKYSKYLYLRTVRVKAANRNTTNSQYLWDLKLTEYVPDNNFGLNLEWTIQCDITQFIVDQKSVFSFAVRDMWVKKLLEELSNSTRQNIVNEKVALQARAELQTQSVGGMGFADKVERQLKEVDFEISNLDATCMPCNTKGGMRIGSIGLAR